MEYSKENINKKGKKYWEKNWDTAKYLKNMANDPSPYIRIISLYAMIMNLKFDNYLQIQSYIQRNLRAAKKLAVYPMERIKNTLLHILQNETYIAKPSLETILKYIDHDINFLKNRKPIMIYQGEPIYDVERIVLLEKQGKICYQNGIWKEKKYD